MHQLYRYVTVAMRSCHPQRSIQNSGVQYTSVNRRDEFFPELSGRLRSFVFVKGSLYGAEAGCEARDPRLLPALLGFPTGVPLYRQVRLWGKRIGGNDPRGAYRPLWSPRTAVIPSATSEFVGIFAGQSDKAQPVLGDARVQRVGAIAAVRLRPGEDVLNVCARDLPFIGGGPGPEIYPVSRVREFPGLVPGINAHGLHGLSMEQPVGERLTVPVRGASRGSMCDSACP